MSRLVICLLLCAVVVHGGHEKYEGHQLYRVAGTSDEIASIEATLDILSAYPAARTASGQLEVLVRISPEEKQSWLAYFDSKNMSYRKVADNLAEIIRDEESEILQAKSNAKRNGRSITWDAYYGHDEINAHLDQLGRDYPDQITVINAGLSYEGRQIKYVRISTSRFENLSKPVIVIDAAVHAREWVTPPVALYIINQLVVDVVNKRIADDIDWVIIPVANPDGYEYSINEDRMWRKTRSRSHAGADQCPGVDGNRNFDHYWGTTPSSANPCAIIYEGPSAFSEPEIRVIRDVVLRDLFRTRLYVSLHSYGNMFLYAWGNNGTVPSNALDMHLTGTRMAFAIEQLALDKADRYIVGNAANVLYYTTGTSRDWTRSVGIPYTYTLELPGYEYGFIVPPNYTRQIVTETWAGIEAGAEYLLSSGAQMTVFSITCYLFAVFLYCFHQLYRVAGLAQEIATLEASLDILSTSPAARTASGKLEALVRLSPEEKQSWLAYFDSKNMSYRKVADNLARIIRDEESKNLQAKAAAKRSGRSISWDAYYGHDEINAHLDELGEKYPDLVTVINAGLSYEGRQVKYVRISTSRFEDLRKPVIIIDAAVHAREWVTPPVALYIINQLVVDVVNKRITDEIDWIIIPVANPDGYEYSISEDRMWRKTRSRSHHGADQCPGVDGNRNFDHYWGTTSGSANPCSNIYEGPSPFSEPEIRVIRDVVLREISRTQLYISLHSFGNMFLYAWGNNGTLPSNGLVLHLAGIRMATAIDKLALEKADRYTVGNAANVLYYTTGTSRDWTRAVGIPYTYTLELPGYEYGFLVPPSYTRQIVTETWAGIEAGAEYVLGTV